MVTKEDETLSSVVYAILLSATQRICLPFSSGIPKIIREGEIFTWNDELNAVNISIRYSCCLYCFFGLIVFRFWHGMTQAWQAQNTWEHRSKFPRHLHFSEEG